MRWTLDDLMALPVSYYEALAAMLEEDARERSKA